MKVLVINVGSSSLKFKIYDMSNEHMLGYGMLEGIGGECKVSYYIQGYESISEAMRLENHELAVRFLLTLLRDKKINHKSIIDLIDAVGHRVAHGGASLREPIEINEIVLQKLESCIELAPLHNSISINVIKKCMEIFNDIPQIAVFDTAFYDSLPLKSFMYGIPYSYYEKYGIRKYGFHGISHKYAMQQISKFIDIYESKMVVCHLGGGASITAIDKGKAVDTSMGFTPLEGLMMGTRSGDIDASVINYLAEKENIECKDVINIFNTKSGFKGISEISGNFIEVFKAASDGNEKAKLAVEMFVYKIIKYIGSYVAAMNGMNMIVFTGGIGQNSSYIRKQVCDQFTYLGVEIDVDKNNESKECSLISSNTSKIQIVVVPTNEELMIARDINNLFEYKE